MSPRLWHHRIADILEAIDKIRRYVADMDFTDFERDDKTVEAVIRNFIIIGEAARQMQETIKDQRPSIPWQLMGDMRNFAVHEYWGVELSTIWETIQNDLPPLISWLSPLLPDRTGS
ncbi:MAG: hypothetical protein ETSY1_42020 [Candidatus Entotheonella factor]|uniref:DUF86 domain-containing protein n=1 Tax=Entotheonella factor TaxID=1429438 RepID=W4L4M2_ENTF1|nr:MAG: hypothetical protein ETSY1_42020 [Candidatus Entotheonella factor]